MSQLIGVFRLGRDAEVRFTQNGDPVASLALAYNYGKKDQDGSRPSQWIDASLWGKRAEAMAPYLKNGGQIYAVINDPHIETYQRRDGGEGFRMVGKISEIEFAGGSKSNSNRRDYSDNNGSGDGGDYRAAREGRQPSNKPKPSFDDLGDDIPFN